MRAEDAAAHLSVVRRRRASAECRIRDGRPAVRSRIVRRFFFVRDLFFPGVYHDPHSRQNARRFRIRPGLYRACNRDASDCGFGRDVFRMVAFRDVDHCADGNCGTHPRLLRRRGGDRMDADADALQKLRAHADRKRCVRRASCRGRIGTRQTDRDRRVRSVWHCIPDVRGKRVVFTGCSEPARWIAAVSAPSGKMA